MATDNTMNANMTDRYDVNLTSCAGSEGERSKLIVGRYLRDCRYRLASKKCWLSMTARICAQLKSLKANSRGCCRRRRFPSAISRCEGC